MTTPAQSPTATLRLALTAYNPERPRWQQQRQYGELRRATEALAVVVANWGVGEHCKLERWYREVDAMTGDPQHAALEHGWCERLEKYEAAWRLYQEAVAVTEGAG